MLGRKIRLALLFGGQSAEHDVSLLSARSVLKAVDPSRYEVLPIGIARDGQWLIGAPAVHLLGRPDSTGTAPLQDIGDVVVAAGPVAAAEAARALSPAGPAGERAAIDVVFPVLHGPHGEDGTVQGLLELAGVPYVGAGVAASAVGMDKILMKRLFAQAGLPVAPFVAASRAEWRAEPETVARRVERGVGYPCFVKPANMGSSLGITRVDAAPELAAAIDEAARFDRRLLIERAAPSPRELECGVLGNETPEVSVVGEIHVARWASFYDYEAKYQPGASELVVPASLPTGVAEEIRSLARRAFLAVDGAGMARVDFFLCGENDIYVSELNTIPGFTPMSMFPLLWEASGVPYADLIDRLVALALERHREAHS